MIDQLTEDQKKQLTPWIKKWVDIGLSTQPADWERAEKGVRGHYTAADLDPPTTMVHVSSPYALTIVGPVSALILENSEAFLALLDSDKTKKKTWSREGLFAALVPELIQGLPQVKNRADWASPISAQMIQDISKAIGDIVKAEFKPSFFSDETYDVGDENLLAAARKVLDSALGKKLQTAAKDSIRDSWHRHLGGQFWCGWTAYATFVRDVVKVEVPVGPREDTDTSCGWWWPHKQFCVISDRPDLIRRDGEGRLHGDATAAIRWRDGWGVYVWHGTRIPADWIEKKAEVDPALALNHPNIEERRCLAEILGWEKVLERLNPTVVNVDSNPQMGTLLEVDLPDAGKERFLKVLCGTGRTFVLPVPPDMQTARQANAWTYGLDEGQYEPEIRT